MKDSTTRVVIMGLCLLVFTTPLFVRVADRVVLGKNDFIPLYVAAKASPLELYNPQPYHDFLMTQFGGFNESLRFTRLPFYAVLLKPLGLLSYQQAHLVWFLLRLGAVILFILLWPHESRGDVALMTCTSLSITVALSNGQDSLLLLLFIALALRWHTGRPIAAGLSLSLCAIKFHLFMLLPLLLLAQRRWQLLQGFIAGAAILLALSFFGGGWNWPSAYFDMLTDSRVHPALAQMPNLHGLFSNLPLEMAFSLVILVASWFAMQRTNFVLGLAVALTGGIPLSYHSYVADCVLLTPVVLILFAHTRVAWLKVMGVCLVSPVLPLMLLQSRPYAYPMQVTLLLFFFSLAFVLLREPRGALVAKPA